MIASVLGKVLHDFFEIPGLPIRRRRRRRYFYVRGLLPQLIVGFCWAVFAMLVAYYVIVVFAFRLFIALFLFLLYLVALLCEYVVSRKKPVSDSTTKE